MDHQKLREQIVAQNPTSQQSDAIFADDLEFLLRASPGSGKTWTSCRRFIWRGANWPYAAGGLALLSFTNAAVQEFQRATINIGQRGLLSEPNYVGTFDSFVEKFIITPFGHLVAGGTRRPKLFLGARPGDRNNAKLQTWTDMGRGRKVQVPAWDIVPYPEGGKLAFKATDSYHGIKLDSAHSALSVMKEFLARGFYAHQHRVFWAYQLLKSRPHIAKVLARRFPEIVVDEAQDTNVWLLYLLHCFRENGTKITLIGDPDQCIFEFSMADADFLPSLRSQWGIPELPLSHSFRCNNSIAIAIRNVVSNNTFCGCGAARNSFSIPYIVRETDGRFPESISAFNKAMQRCSNDHLSSAIVCRAHEQLESIHGEGSYSALQGIAKDLAKAAFMRDFRKAYKSANDIVIGALRSLIDDSDYWNEIDDNPDSQAAEDFRMASWKLTRTQSGLPGLDIRADQWIDTLRHNLCHTIRTLGCLVPGNLNKRITAKGTNAQLPLFNASAMFSAL